MGLVVGGLPACVYGTHCGEVDAFDLLIFAGLAFVGIGYAQMALMTALLHDSLAAANPITIVRSLYRIGRPCLTTCLVTTITFLGSLTLWSMVLLHSPSLEVGLFGLWGSWVLTLYAVMMVVRVLGTLYYQHETHLSWFRTSKG